MKSTSSRTSKEKSAKPRQVDAPATANAAITELKALATKATLDGMARYAIPSDKAFGVAMRDVQAVAKRIGKNHALALELWATGWYEARLLAIYLDDPASLTVCQMDEWCRDFDNWAVVDTACFALFDRTPHAWGRVKQWAGSKEEFVKRAAFALIWGLSVHDKTAGDDAFLTALKLVEEAAADERNFVKKAVSMALRATGKRNPALNAAALVVAERLMASTSPSAQWIGKDACKELRGGSVVKRIAKK